MWRRLLPVAVLLLGLALFLMTGLERHFSFAMLCDNHAEITAWVAAHRVVSELGFVVGYAVVVAFSLPVAVLITPLGGYLFGTWLGALLSVIAATVGSIAVFLAARTAFHDLLHARAGAGLARLEEGFRRDSFSYLLFLRLVPIFPFWLVNIVPGLLGMRLDRFTLATLIGIVPGAVVYASVGAGFGLLFEKEQMPDLSIIFQWRILGPLLALALLSLVPVVYRHMRSRKARS
jgi:uncharacterized membrane protein YdjX (TVP38/TMEM64 family)